MCEVSCLDAEGEAAISGNDIPSARIEALARAKWAAMEQAVGVEVKAQSVIQNMALVDDAVSMKVKGVVTKHRILKEETRKDTLWVRANVCIEPVKAQEALSSLALNNSLAVFIPARKPRAEGQDKFEETNLISESLIGRLAEGGYTVIDVAPKHAVDAGEIEKAMQSGNFLSLRSLLYRFLANVLIVGKVDYTISTKKGQDIGYGIAMPMNSVNVRLTYRIVSRDSSGNTIVLSAGVEEGKGLASTVEGAASAGMRDIAGKLPSVVLEKMGRYIKGVTKKVIVKTEGVTDIGEHANVKNILQNLAWVTDIEDKGMDEFIVSYPENPLYLANSIEQKGRFKIVRFSPDAITATYRK
jgi:hypothetical protein